MKKALTTAGFVLLSFMLSPRAMASNFSQFYVFGDSLSETGNLSNATEGLIPPCPPYAPGRFSNGDIWVDFVGNEIGLTPTIFKENPNPTESTSFASGGSFSGSGSENVFPPASNLGLPGVLGQVDLFLEQNNQQADPNALYTVWGGANDYVFGNVTDPSQTVGNLSNAIGKLAQAGAKNIAVFNLPDLGQIPFATAEGNEVSTGLTQLTDG
ncbi:MAG: SGNH/GDSL hydrolase family protein, partial [Rivularia sp. ALOHA_DT_140]|nr:SGNH/GDSL hydrolase family protein [Rivularia sp. ALOHA_DT_140]